MTDAEKRTLKTALEAKRQQLKYDLCEATGRLAFGGGESDPVDQMLSMRERNFTADMLTRLSDALENINRALRAIEDGSYGLCIACEEPIAVKRLQTIPWATYCVGCQEELETRARHAELRFVRPEAA